MNLLFSNIKKRYSTNKVKKLIKPRENSPFSGRANKSCKYFINNSKILQKSKELQFNFSYFTKTSW